MGRLKETPEEFYEYYSKKADKAYNDYQETGEQKYYNAYYNADMIAEAFLKKMEMKDNDEERIGYLSTLLSIGAKLDKAVHSEGRIEDTAKSILTDLRQMGIYQSKWA